MKNVKKLLFALTAILCLQQPCHAGFTDTLSSWGSSALQWIQQNPRITGLFATIFTAQAVYSYRQNTTIQKQTNTIEKRNKTIEEKNKTVQEKDVILAGQAEAIEQKDRAIQQQTNTIESLEADLGPIIKRDKQLKKLDNNISKAQSELSELEKRAQNINISHQIAQDSLELSRILALIEVLESSESTETKNFIDWFFDNNLTINIPHPATDFRHSEMLKRLQGEIEKELQEYSFVTYILKQNTQRLPIQKAKIIALLFNRFKNDGREYYNTNQIIIHANNKAIEPSTSYMQTFQNGINGLLAIGKKTPVNVETYGFLPLKKESVQIVTLPHLPPLQIGTLDHDAVRNPLLKNLPEGTMIIQRKYAS